MKDITRIHIAKVPYNIELSAKKELQTYIDTLEAYTADSELMTDIEIRITELLLERDIKPEDVIASADVTAIREQLGEPKEFMTDDSVADTDQDVFSAEGTRKLYRNLDSAVLGGVLSGVASYLRVSVIWTRLAFIVLTFISFGLSLLLYIIGWLIIPAARTAAEKLQMSGRPVTLSSIRELNDSSSTINVQRRVAIIKRVLTILLGITALGVAAGAAALMAAVAYGISHETNAAMFNPYAVMIALMFASGALLFALSVLVAVAAFAQKFNKRIWISAVIIIALGLTSFGAALTIGAIYQRSEYEEIQRNTVEITEKLPADFSTVTALELDIPYWTHVNYTVATTTPAISQRMIKDSPKVKIVVENGTAKLSLDDPNHNWAYESSIDITGPQLLNINVQKGNMTYGSATQEKLEVSSHNESSVSLVESRVDVLKVDLSESGQFFGEDASVASASLVLADESIATLGNIKTLQTKVSDVCGSNTKASVTVKNILNATYDYNGIQTASRTLKEPCYEIVVGENTHDNID